MRLDSAGLFWEDQPAVRGRNAIARSMPPIPDTGWMPPSYFPDLSHARVLGVDVETYDPDLRTKGPGWGRGVGHIVGISVAVPGQGWYFPMRHTVEPDWNMDPNSVLAWARAMLGLPMPKVGANLLYDVGWLAQEGVKVNGPLYDVQFAEALIDSETPNVALEQLGQKYLGEGKESTELYQWSAAFYGGKPTGAQRANIYRSPPRLVGPYAASDTTLPIEILQRQWPVLQSEGLLHLFDVECRLIPLLAAMRMKGVRVNTVAAEELYDSLGVRLEGMLNELEHTAGRTVEIYAADSIARAFDDAGFEYPKSATGKPSFRAAWLDTCDNPIAKMINAARKLTKLRETFVKGYILEANVRGRVHGQFHPLKGDDGGARSGRFASSMPNLQNLPVRTPEGVMVRKAFVAEWESGGIWRKYDHSQIEYRMLANHAVGPGSDNVRSRFINDPSTDYHAATIDLVHGMAGILLPRTHIKNLNFGLIYGMQRVAMAALLGLPLAEADKIFEAYHAGVPFAQATMDAEADFAQYHGYTQTILGRRSRFDLWQPKAWAAVRTPLPLDQAIAAYGPGIKRANLHKALNRKLQGGAADVMKRGMLACWEDGIFDETGVPTLTVHDELDFEDNERSARTDKAFDAMQHTLEHCLDDMLRLPLKVECTTGPSWGHAK